MRKLGILPQACSLPYFSLETRLKPSILHISTLMNYFLLPKFTMIFQISMALTVVLEKLFLH